MTRQMIDPRPGTGPQRTHRRIVDAALALYASVGPAATTVSAVAARAGVQRLTVYRHVGGEAGLLDACAERIAADPTRPVPGTWVAHPDPVDRLLVALDALFAHYRATEPLMANLLRDETAHPALARLTAAHHAMIERAIATLAAGWTADEGRVATVRAALRLATGFGTWRTLTRDGGLDDADAADVLVGLLEAAAEPLA